MSLLISISAGHAKVGNEFIVSVTSVLVKLAQPVKTSTDSA